MFKKELKRFIKSKIQLFRRHKAQSALTQLTSHTSSNIKAVGIALRESLNNTTSDAELTFISSIEQRRSSLLHSDKQILFIDFGTGGSDSNRTEEEMKMGVQSAICVSNICKFSKPAFWGMFLFKLIRQLEPSSCVELGSCVGISAAYQAAALSINNKGNLITLEGSPGIAKIAEETLEGLMLHNASVVTGPFHETLNSVLKSAAPIDFFFNDGHHDHDAVLLYFNEAMPFLSETAVIIIDDISWSPGMRKAWTEIEDDQRVAVTIDLETIGIAFMSNHMASKEKFRIPLGKIHNG